MRRCGSTGKACDGEIEAAPEKMHRTGFADEAGTKALQDSIHLNQHAPKRVRRSRIIGSMSAVLREWDRVRQLVRHLTDIDHNSESNQQGLNALVKLSDRLWLERE